MALNKNKETKKTETPETTYDIEVLRAKQVKETYAFDLKVNGVTIYGCWLRESKNGNNFVSFPSYKGNDGKYYSHVYFKIDEKVQAEIEKQIESKLAE